MASGRILKTQISFSEQVNDLSIYSALLFTWMIPHADDFGRMHGNARKVKALVVPMRDDFTSIKVEECLVEISKAQLIDRYRFDGEFYIQFPAWEEHQSGLHKRTKSKLPEPPEKNLIPGNSGKFRPELELELELEQEQEKKREGDKSPESSRGKKTEGQKKTKFDYKTFPLPDFIDREMWDGWMEARKAKKGAMSEFALSAHLNTLIACRDAGIEPNAALVIARKQEWTGLEVEWVRNALAQKSPNPAANRGSGFGKQPAQRPDYSNLGKPEKEPDFIDSTAKRIN